MRLLHRSRVAIGGVGILFAAIVAWHVLSPSGSPHRSAAISKVKSHRLAVATAKGTRDMTVDELIRDYDLGTRELVTEASSDRTDEKLSWRAVYVAGEYSVGCDVKGRLYSFETDMINVTPVSDAARIIFDLREAPGESYSEKRERAEKDEEVLSTAIDLYAVDNGRPPSTEQSFEALVEKPTVEPMPRNWYGPYLRSSGTPLDPWGSPYRYEYELRSGKDHYTITSYGTDGGPGGEGEARDIVLQDDTN